MNDKIQVKEERQRKIMNMKEVKRYKVKKKNKSQNINKIIKTKTINMEEVKTYKQIKERKRNMLIERIMRKKKVQ